MGVEAVRSVIPAATQHQRGKQYGPAACGCDDSSTRASNVSSVRTWPCSMRKSMSHQRSLCSPTCTPNSPEQVIPP